MASETPVDKPDWTDPEPNEYDHHDLVGRTYAETHRAALSEAEAEAVQLLYEDGWTYKELELAFQVSNEAVTRAIRTGKP